MGIVAYPGNAVGEPLKVFVQSSDTIRLTFYENLLSSCVECRPLPQEDACKGASLRETAAAVLVGGQVMVTSSRGQQPRQ